MQSFAAFLFSWTGKAENEVVKNGGSINNLREILKKLDVSKFSDAMVSDRQVVSRIKDGLRNHVSEDILNALCILAAADEWDFLLLVWCVANSPDVRSMILLIHLSVRDKDNRDIYFNFESNSSIFIDHKERAIELNYIKDNLKEFLALLLPIAEKLNPKWAKTIISIK